MSYIKLGAIVLSLFAVTAFVWASESDELREKAELMQREAAELAEKGHKKEAANLKRKSMAMLKEAKHLEHGGSDLRLAYIKQLKEQLEKLRREEGQLEDEAEAGERLADVRHAAERVERELRQFSGGPHHKHGAPHDEIAGRLEHMRIAVEHLNQAGLHDIAEHVAQRAEAAERELHERHRHNEEDVMHEVIKQLDEIRHEVGRLREDVNELRKKR